MRQLRVVETTFLAALLFLSQVTSAQEPSEPGFSEVVRVELVNVELWATDKNGGSVSGLTAEDFVVKHDGEIVPIEFFSEIRSGRAVSPTGEFDQGLAEPPGGHLIVYFDELNLHPTNRTQVIEALREVLDSRVVESESVLILRQTEGLYVVSPFGASRREIGRALDELAKEGVEGSGASPPIERAMAEVRALWTTSQDASGSGTTGMSAVPGSAGPGGVGGSAGGSPRTAVGGAGTSSGSAASGMVAESCDILTSRAEPLVESFARERALQIGMTLERLSEAVTFLAGLQGVKTLLYVSDRLESSPGTGLASYVQSFCPISQPGFLLSTMSEQMTETFMDVARHANANRVTLYALQGEGLRTRSSGSASSRGQRRRGGSSGDSAVASNERGGLLMLSSETGGRTVYNRNDLVPAIQEIGGEITSYYSLAFRPPAGSDSLTHRIEVEALGGAIKTRHRKGYLEKSPDERLREKLLGALNLGLVANPLGIRLGAGTIEAEGEGQFKLPLQILVPADQVVGVPTDGSPMATVVVKLIVHDASAGALITRDQTFRARLPEDPKGQWIPLVMETLLPAGVHAVAVGAMDPVSGESSYVSTSIELGNGS